MFHELFRNLFHRQPHTIRRPTFRPMCEALEDRELLSTVRTLVFNQITPFYASTAYLGNEPVLSRDGTQAVFATTTSADNMTHIQKINSDGTGLTALDNIQGGPGSPDFSFDVSANGLKVTYQYQTSQGPGIRIIDSGGARDLFVATGGSMATRLTADGTKVFFMVDRDTSVAGSGAPLPAGLYVIDLVQGGGPVQIVTKAQVAAVVGVSDPDNNIFPFGQVGRYLDVSDDGSHVIFGVDTGSLQKPVVFGVNGDGTGLHQLTQVGPLQIDNFGISGDGSTVFDVIPDPQSGVDQISVSNFDGSNRHLVDGLNGVGANARHERMEMTRDGSKLLVNEFARLINTDGSGVVDLRPPLGVSIGNVEAITMNSNATRFLYIATDNGAGALAMVDLNPSTTGAAPTVAEPHVAPSFSFTSGQPVTVTDKVSASTTIQSVSATVLVNGVEDTYGNLGLTDNGSGTFSGQFGNRPNDVGTLLLRVTGETVTADGLDHLTVLDADPTAAAPPTVTMTAPANGSNTNNSQPNLSANAVDNSGTGLANLQFQFSKDGGMTWQSAGSAQTAAPFVLTFPLPDGTYQARAIVSDKAGNNTTSTAVSFIIDTVAPTTSNLVVTPNPTATAPTVSATISDSSGGKNNIIAAEYFIDSPGGNGSGTPLSGTFTSATVNVSGTLTAAQFSALTEGTHTIFIHGEDAAGNWSTPVSISFVKESAVPTVTSLVPSVPTITNAQIGNSTFTLRITYSELMNTTVAPSISFSPTAASLTFASGAWDASHKVYTASFNVASTGVKVSGIAVTVNSAQSATGVPQTSFSQNNVFAINIIQPIVVSATPSVTTIGDAQVGTTFTIALLYNTPMKTTITPVIAFTPSVASTLTFTSGSWNAAMTIYTASYKVAGGGGRVPGVAITVSAAQDLTGDPQLPFNQSNLFAIGTSNPTVTSITPSIGTISNAQVGTATFRLAVQFSTIMNNLINPVISFSPAVNSTLTPASGSWNASHTVFTAVYNVLNAGVSVPSVAVTISGAQTPAGVPQLSFTQNSVFAIDTATPIVTSIKPSVPTITDAQLGSGTFSLAIQFSAAMNTKVMPLITFTPALSPTLTFASGSWDSAHMLFTAVYNVADAFVIVPSVAVAVSGGKKADGNPQAVKVQAGVFAVDTVNPIVLSITPNIANVTDAQAGKGTFTLAVLFSEVMNKAVAPSLSFIPPIGSTLTFASGNWNAAGTLYTAAYNVAASGVSILGVAVAVSGGQDSDGNLQHPFEGTNVFTINTVSPTVVSVTTSVDTITNAQVGPNGFNIQVMYNTVMNTAVAPVIAFTPDVSSTLKLASGSWDLSHTLYTATYNVSNAGASVPSVLVTINSAKNSVGNPQAAFSQNSAFAINITGSSGSGPDVSQTTTNTSASINATAYFGETFVPTVSGALTQLNVLDITHMYSAQTQSITSTSATIQIYQGGIITSNPSLSNYDTPAGALLYSQSFTFTLGNNSILFTTPPLLQAGQTYLWRVVPNGVSTIYTDIATNNPYPQGDTLAGPGIGYDLQFQTFMKPSA